MVDGGSLAPRDGRVSSKNETPPACSLFHPRSSKTNQLLPAYQVYCFTYCCTAVLLYVVNVWSVVRWRVHCVVRSGWVGRSARGFFFSSCGRYTFFMFQKYRPHTGDWEYHCPHCGTPLLFYYRTYCCTAALLPCYLLFFLSTYLHTEDDTLTTVRNVLLHCRTALVQFGYFNTYIQRMIQQQFVFVRHTGRQQAYFGSTTRIHKHI